MNKNNDLERREELLHEDFDIDEILSNDHCFKPITKGLGFHMRSNDDLGPSKDFVSSIKMKNKAKINSNGLKNDSFVSKHSITQGPEFYLESIISNEIEPRNEENIKKPAEWIKAEYYLKTSAFITDFIYIFFLFITTSSFFYYLSPISSIRELLGFIDIINAVGIGFIFTIYYFTYFIFMDMTEEGTLGKNLFKIKVINDLGHSLTISQLFIRSFLTIISPLFVFIPLLMNFHEILTGTTTVRKL